MLRIPARIRNVARIQLRSYRRKKPLTGTHISALQNNGLLQDAGEIKLEARDPREIETNLKTLGFEELNSTNYIEDLLLQYLKHTNSGFKPSVKNLLNLQRSLKEGKLDDTRRLKILFDYLLKESEIEIKMLNVMGPEKLREAIISKRKGASKEELESPEQIEDAIFSDLFHSAGQNSESYLNHVDLTYQILTDMNDRKNKGLEILSLEQLVQVFELSKLIPIEGRRKRGLFLAGNLIYSLGTVRMDPVNESFYIDSLVNYGFYKKAYDLFESNRAKVNERWWYELGMMVALRANYLQKFDKLMVASDLRFGEYPYVSLKVLKLAVKRKLLIKDIRSANKLTGRFLEIVAGYGCKRYDQQENDDKHMINFTSEEQADEFLNEKTAPTDYDFITLIDYNLFRKNIPMAMRLVAKYLQTEGITDQNYRFLIVQLKFNLLQNFEHLKNSLGPHMNPESAHQRLDELEKSFNDVRKEHNLDSSFSQELLFDNVASLASHPELIEIIETFLTRKVTTDDEKRQPSKKFQGLLKVLLATGKEEQAFFLLSKMEEALRKSQKSPELLGNQFYPEVQAHHYAVFVEYFSLLFVKVPKLVSNFERRITHLVDRMENLDVSYNSVLLTKLLIFYKNTNNFNKCFEIINQVMEEKFKKHMLSETDRTRLYNRRDVTRPLYLEIWRVYGKYYKIFHKELERVDKKSNYYGWKTQVERIIQRTKVHPDFPIRIVFCSMVHYDNVLPDSKMYHIILTTVMRSRDWAAISGVLTTMAELHGLPLEDQSFRYVMRGLEKELIVVLTKKIKAQNSNMEESKIQALERVKELKLRGLLLVPKSGTKYDVDDLISQVLLLLRIKDSADQSFSEVTEAFKELKVEKKNFTKLVDHLNEKV
ncbi:SOV1 (YMR066W) [Zygosaccharomyces parabailii]|nr:SOV1 (YMR066W) [Zygosaccharomyces parabailii]